MMRTLMAVTALVCLFGSSAEARSGHRPHYRHYQHYAGRPGGLVRLVHALAGRQRSGAELQSRPILDTLRFKRGRPDRGRYCRLAALCR